MVRELLVTVTKKLGREQSDSVPGSWALWQGITASKVTRVNF